MGFVFSKMFAKIPNHTSCCLAYRNMPICFMLLYQSFTDILIPSIRIDEESLFVRFNDIQTDDSSKRIVSDYSCALYLHRDWKLFAFAGPYPVFSSPLIKIDFG